MGRGRSTTRNISTASAANSSACSTHGPRTASCSAWTCGCGRSATAVPLVVSLALARGLPAGTRPRLGALCLDQGAAHRRRSSLCARVPGIRASVRVPALSRLRRVRVLARHEGADRPRSVAARTRSALEARPRRHPRDRVHRAIHAAGARRQRPAAAERRRCWRCCRCWPARNSCPRPTSRN